MAAILEALGKDVQVCNGFAVPPHLRFLDPGRKLKQLNVDRSAEQLDDREVLIILDTTAWAQLGAMDEVVKKSPAIKVVLDHHVSGDDLGAELFKNAEAEATGRLVVEAADQLGVRLTPQIARPAFVALATDTGWFRFASTTADTLRLAARLVEAGDHAGPTLPGTLRDRSSRPAATDRPNAGPLADRFGRPLDPHVDQSGRFRGHRRPALR